MGASAAGAMLIEMTVPSNICVPLNRDWCQKPARKQGQGSMKMPSLTVGFLTHYAYSNRCRDRIIKNLQRYIDVFARQNQRRRPANRISPTAQQNQPALENGDLHAV